jgi:flagellin
MRINTNISSLTAIESGTNNTKLMNASLEKLSSGLAINKASDDASGMAIADKLRTQASSITQAIANANSANTLIQIGDKAMAEQSNILDIVTTKLLQASTSTTSGDGRKAIANDISALLKQLNSIASSTNYNGVTLLQLSSSDTSSAASLTFQIGDNSTDKVTTSNNIRVNTHGLGLTNGVGTLNDLKVIVDAGDITSSEALQALTILDEAVTDLNSYRSNFGAAQNQIESSLRNMLTTKTNLKAAESIIRDVDYAQESANFNKLNIVGQASSYAQSQANAIPQSVLQFLT